MFKAAQLGCVCKSLKPCQRNTSFKMTAFLWAKFTS